MSYTLSEYHAAPFRTPICAGGVYPAKPKPLATYLDGLLATTHPQPAAHCQAIVSPHIDYARGGAVYAAAWQAAAQSARQCERVIIIGTDHKFGGALFTLTKQHYATPFGVLPTHQPSVHALAQAVGEKNAFRGELYHAIEHSLELPLVWLHHLRGGAPVEVVPILVGSFFEWVRTGTSPASQPNVQAFLHTLHSIAQDKPTLLIASGDLAHVGPAFDGEPLNAYAKEQLRHDDATLMAHIHAGDAEGWFNELAQVKDANNVCGLAPVYLTLKMHAGLHGHTLAYAQCPADDAETSIVSVCGSVLG